MPGIALDNILKIVDEALPEIMTQIQTNMPKILELGGKILTALVDRYYRISSGNIRCSCNYN